MSLKKFAFASAVGWACLANIMTVQAADKKSIIVQKGKQLFFPNAEAMTH